MTERTYVIKKSGTRPKRKEKPELSPAMKELMDEYVQLERDIKYLEEQRDALKPRITEELKEYGQSVKYPDGMLSVVTKKLVKWSDYAREDKKARLDEWESEMKTAGEYKVEIQSFPRFGKAKEEPIKEV